MKNPAQISEVSQKIILLFSYFEEDLGAVHSSDTSQLGIRKANPCLSRNHNFLTNHRSEASYECLSPWPRYKHKRMKDVWDQRLPASCPFRIHRSFCLLDQERDFPVMKQERITYVEKPTQTGRQNGFATFRRRALWMLKAKCFSVILMISLFKYTNIVDYNCYLILVICFCG